MVIPLIPLMFPCESAQQYKRRLLGLGGRICSTDCHSCCYCSLFEWLQRTHMVLKTQMLWLMDDTPAVWMDCPCPTRAACWSCWILAETAFKTSLILDGLRLAQCEALVHPTDWICANSSHGWKATLYICRSFKGFSTDWWDWIFAYSQRQSALCEKQLCEWETNN